MNSQLIELHMKEKSEALLHLVQQRQLLSQINGDRLGAVQHLFHNIGVLFLTVGGWLTSR